MIGVWGKVTRVREDRSNLQILDVQLQDSREIKAIHYVIYDRNRCKLDTQVQVNVAALDLQLGTGGYGFVMAIYKDEIVAQDPSYQGHIMKLRYSPFQTPVLAIESEESDCHALFCSPFSLEGKKILLGELHSMLPLIASLLYRWQKDRKIVYIMDDQAALYVTLSDHVRYLKEKLNLFTITFGQALGGDIETVNIYTALEAAVKVLQADDIIVTHGPGVVGTGTQRGFSGMQLVQWLHAVHTCGGEGIIIPRIQFGDRRKRHYGLSHHTLEALLHHALIPAYVPIPVQEKESNLKRNSVKEAGSRDRRREEEVLAKQYATLQSKHWIQTIPVHQIKREIIDALDWYSNPIQTMGRSFEDDPYFYYAVGAAFHLYREQLC